MDASTAQEGGARRFDPIGFLLVIVSALCYASLGIFGKLAMAEGQPTASMLATRFVLATLLAWGFLGASPRWRAAVARARSRCPKLFLWGVTGFAGQSALYFSALRLIPASLTEVLLYTCPAFLAIILWVRNRRRPSWPVLAALGMALLGTWLAAAPQGGPASRAGVLLAVLAGLWYATFLLGLDRITPGVPAIVSTACIAAGAAAAFVAALPFAGGYHPPVTRAAWGAILGMIAGPTFLGFALFVAGMKRTGPQVAAILSTFEPLGTLLLAVLILGERLRPGQWIGAAMILAAAIVLAAGTIDRTTATA